MNTPSSSFPECHLIMTTVCVASYPGRLFFFLFNERPGYDATNAWLIKIENIAVGIPGRRQDVYPPSENCGAFL